MYTSLDLMRASYAEKEREVALLHVEREALRLEQAARGGQPIRGANVLRAVFRPVGVAVRSLRTIGGPRPSRA